MYAEGHALPGNRVTSPTWKVIPAASRFAASITPSPMAMPVAKASSAVNALTSWCRRIRHRRRADHPPDAGCQREVIARDRRHVEWESETVANILRRVG